MTLVKVTQKHIDIGIRRNGCLCPDALAIIDLLKSGVYVDVCYGEIWFETRFEDMKRIPCSKEEEMNIKEFDNHGTMIPHSFELDIPKEYLKEEVE